VIAAVVLGLFATSITPREEEPQIVVPMVDVFVQAPGLSASEVERLVSTPMEKLLWEIPGVDDVYTTSRPNMAMGILRFDVGEDEEDSLVKVYSKLNGNMDRIPIGVQPPLIRLEGIDDAILDVMPKIAALVAPDGGTVRQLMNGMPEDEKNYTVKWDGEWQITYEVFRDMGIAFAVVMVLMYMLVVAWFKSFLTPILIMVPIPLTLVGILPGHWLTGTYFTATSMIGFIALAGIIVRNSILLVDFIEQELEADTPLREAVLQAGAIRFRPIFLTAAALVVGGAVILLDPIFSGLAVSLIFGVVVSTLLTLVVIPVIYFMAHRRSARKTVEA
jgi:multidrug efflux pump subunit AcrB